MWRNLIIGVFMTSAAASGQTLATAEAAQPSVAAGDIQTVETGVPQAHVVQRYNKLRRGHDEQIAISVAKLKWECLDYPPPKARSSTFLFADPGSLHLETVPGFTILYGDGKDFKKDSKVTSTYTPAGEVIFLKLKAAGDMPLGDYTIHGKLGYFNPTRETCSQQQDVVIPVTVVDHDVEVAKNEWPFNPSPDHNFRDTVTEVPLGLLFIVLLPFLLVYGAIVCGNPFCGD
jgi:hypothetical protein